MQAIRTTYHGPTDTLKSRVSATWAADRDRVYVYYDPRLSLTENERVALRRLVDNDSEWRGGDVGNSTTVWVHAEKGSTNPEVAFLDDLCEWLEGIDANGGMHELVSMGDGLAAAIRARYSASVTDDDPDPGTTKRRRVLASRAVRSALRARLGK